MFLPTDNVITAILWIYASCSGFRPLTDRQIFFILKGVSDMGTGKRRPAPRMPSAAAQYSSKGQSLFKLSSLISSASGYSLPMCCLAAACVCMAEQALIDRLITRLSLVR